MKSLLAVAALALLANVLFTLGAQALPAGGESALPVPTLLQYLVDAALVVWGGALAWTRRRPRRVVLVGSEAAVAELHALLDGDRRYRVVGTLAPEAAGGRLAQWAAACGAAEVVLADPCGGAGVAPEALTECRLSGVAVSDYHAFLERVAGRIPVTRNLACHLAFARGFDRAWAASRLRRGLELAAALVLSAFSLPLLLVAAVAIKLDSRGPVLYRQERVGANGRTFRVAKLRTMYVDAEAAGPRQATEDDPRITRVGRVLRRLRIDELPQLWNVLTGDMSLIGPRPERPCYMEELSEKIPFFRYRTAVKPGITGWAQVNAEYAVTLEEHREKLEYDLYYLKNQGPLLDLKILLRTVGVVVCGRGR